MRRSMAWIVVVVWLVSSVPSMAGVVFDNGVPNLVNGYHSDFDTSSPSDTVQVGDDFIIAAPGKINHVTFYGAYAFDNVPPSSDEFSIRVFPVVGGIPNASPLFDFNHASVSRVDTGDSLAGLDLYRYEASIPVIFLEAGTYLLSVVNDTTGTDSDWYWATSNAPADSWERDSDGIAWVADANGFAFEISLDSVVHDNGLPDGSNAYHSDFDTSSPSDTVQVGDVFTILTTSRIEVATWYGVYASGNSPPAGDDFTIRVFEVNAGTPDSAPLLEFAAGPVRRSDTGENISSFFDVYRYDFDFGESLLAPGDYLLSIVNDTSGALDDWYWATASGDGISWERDLDGDSWIADNNDYAFLLSVTASPVFYDNGLPDLINAFHSDFDESSPSDTVQVGDDFVVTTGTTLREMIFYGVYGFDNTPPAQDDFTIRVFEFSAGVPDAVALHEFHVGAISRADSGLDTGGFDIYQFRAEVAETPLSPGSYFLSIVGNTTGADADWYWCTTGGAADSFERDSDVASWIPDNNDFAFTLSRGDRIFADGFESGDISSW